MNDILKFYTASDVMQPLIINKPTTIKSARNITSENNSKLLCIRRDIGITEHIDSAVTHPPKGFFQTFNPSTFPEASVTEKSPISLVLKLIEDNNPLYVIDGGKCRGIITRKTLFEKGFLQ